ncbi:MAG TPA: glycosyltransferase family 4 protein [Candidatus Omnitrophota bacterium]|nr:glycosyltransferase family 4 protein [Candidatus Omnitrophota bacterium]
MPRVNLLYVITKLELGGAQKQLLSLLALLDKERFRPFLFTAQEGLLISEAQTISGLILKKSSWLERPINPFKDFLALIEIYRFIKKNKIDLVHTHSSKAGILGRFAARLAKVKLIIHTVHGWSFNDYQPRLIRRLFICLERITTKFSHKIIVVSNYDKQKGLSNGIGEEEKYRLIRYGIDADAFNIKDSGIRSEFGLSPQEPLVGMIACFKPQKAPLDFIKLASLVSQSLPKVKFLLVGDGILRPQVENLIKKFNLQGKVILSGWRRDIPQILSAMDVFVLTSLWEGLPISVLEAMAAAKPVAATDTGGIAEVIIEAKTGFLAAPGDMPKLSERLICLLQDENLRKLIAKNARIALSLDFLASNTAKRIQELYGLN